MPAMVNNRAVTEARTNLQRPALRDATNCGVSRPAETKDVVSLGDLFADIDEAALAKVRITHSMH